MDTEPKTVELRIRGQQLELQPVVPEARALLTVRRHTLSTENGCRIGFVDERFYEGPEDVRELFARIKVVPEQFPSDWFDFFFDVLRCATAVVDALYERLVAAGYLVLVRDFGDPPASLGQAVLSDSGLSAVASNTIADFIAHSSHGSIVSAGYKQIDLVAAIANMYPDAQMAVLLDTVEQLERLGIALQRRLGRRRVSWATSAETSVGAVKGVHVTTFGGLGTDACEAEQRDVVLVTDALSLLPKRNRQALVWASRARVYGLLSASETLGPRDRQALRCVLGPHAIEVGAGSTSSHRPLVYWVRIDGGRHAARQGAPRPAHAPALWTDRRRGRIIARLAVAVAERDTDVLRRYPCLIDLLPTFRPPKVLALADDLRQATMLAKELPTWPVAMGADAHLGCLSEAEQTLLVARRVVEPQVWTNMICTRAALSQINLDRIDVVVRADGGTGIPYELSCLPPMSIVRPRLVVVDIWDRDPALRARARARCDAYVQAGWESTRASTSDATGAMP